MPKLPSTETIVVIGGGISGLATAHALEAKGYQLTLLEQSERLGGRILTRRYGESAQVPVELGALRIPNSHKLTLSIIQSLNLKVVSLPYLSQPSLYCLGAHKFKSDAKALFKNTTLPLSENEQSLGLPGVLKKSMACFAPLIQSEVKDWLAMPLLLEKYNSYSVAQFLQEQGVSSNAIQIFTAGMGDVAAGSILDFVRHFKYLMSTSDWFTIEGGMDKLVSAFAERIKSNIHCGAFVNSIEQQNSHIRISFRKNGKENSIQADRVVLSVPFPALHKIQIIPPLSAQKQAVINELPVAAAIKAALFLNEDFLQRHKNTPRHIKFGSSLEATWEPVGDKALLLCYIKGSFACELDALYADPYTRQQRLLDALQGCFPEIHSDYQDGVFHHWTKGLDGDGAYSFFKPGQFLKFINRISKPEKKLHFAGDHTSELPGWMQGALQSSQRVVNEINEANQ